MLFAGLQIAVCDALLVRSIQRVADLPSIFQRLLERQWTFQWLALYILHYEVIRPHIVERADVRVIQSRNRAASRSKRSLNFSFEVLIATVRSSRVSRAFHTSPFPPAPRGPGFHMDRGVCRKPAAYIWNDSTPVKSNSRVTANGTVGGATGNAQTADLASIGVIAAG